MSIYDNSRPSADRYGVTLETLKEELHALNMRVLLSLQNHDDAEQSKLEQQIRELQVKIDDMKSGGHAV
jgi:TolA-binding protein